MFHCGILFQRIRSFKSNYIILIPKHSKTVLITQNCIIHNVTSFHYFLIVYSISHTISTIITAGISPTNFLSFSKENDNFSFSLLFQEWAIPLGTAHFLTLQNQTASQLPCLRTPDFVVVVSGENKYFASLVLVFLRILQIMRFLSLCTHSCTQ